MLGAAALTALAAMRAGAGLVTAAVPEGLNAALHKKLNPEIMTLPLPETPEQSLSQAALPALEKSLKKYSAVAIGPGLSQDSGTRKLILKFLEMTNRPVVIDADALNALSGRLSVLTQCKAEKILTPHPGEMAKLIGGSKAQIEKDRIKIARNFAKTYKCTLVLKGHRTVVADARGKVSLNKTGNAGMATAGSGDVLTGIIAAFLAQGIPAPDAARLGVYLHGKAGDRAAKKKGKVSLIATDIIKAIPSILKAR